MIEKLNGPGDGIHIGALFKETSQYYNPNAKRDLLYNSKKEDEEENSDEEPEDSGDEEKNSEDEWVEDLSALQVKHEEKAQSIRMSMSLDKPARLGDLPGNWTLYSLQALKACAETPHGYYVDEDWTAGELEIMDPDPDDYPIFYNTNLNLTGSELYWLGMCLSVPKFASSTSVREIGSGNDGEVYQFQVTFLTDISSSCMLLAACCQVIPFHRTSTMLLFEKRVLQKGFTVTMITKTVRTMSKFMSTGSAWRLSTKLMVETMRFPTPIRRRVGKRKMSGRDANNQVNQSICLIPDHIVVRDTVHTPHVDP
ncbi:hypothetical protein P3342_013484 [Pyrenophora teres f. teres]|nr:hypothetical protein P3342_013484 [Pyrenophora teres f. teres]